MENLSLIFLIVIAICFVAVLAMAYKGDTRVTVASAVGLLLSLLLLFNVA